jgi:hypothetical protein
MLPTRPRFTRVRAAALGTVAALALLAACEAKMPTAAEVDDMDASKATATAQHFQFMKVGDPNTTYTVDGKVATSAEAQAIKPNEIATIDVRKENRDGVASSSINIRTRAAMGLGPVALGDSGQQVHVMMHRDVNGAVDSTGAHTYTAVISENPDGRRSSVVVGSDDAMAAEHHMKMRNFDGIVVLDGVRVSAAKLASLSPNDIVSMEVIKGDAATKLFAEPAAANGVIRITTKAAKK